jgi:hypothetical protein
MAGTLQAFRRSRPSNLRLTEPMTSKDVRALGRTLNSPLTFAGLYAVLLLACAAIYYCYLGDFYETTAIYESGFSQTEGTLYSELTDVFRQATRNAPSAIGMGPDTNRLAADSVTLANLSVPDTDTVGFEVRYDCVGQNSVGSAILMLSMKGHWTGFQVPSNGVPSYQYEVDQDQASRDPVCGYDVGTLAAPDHNHAQAAIISTNADVVRKVDALVRAKAGFTDLLPGRGPRSLYLSAVTITTLGFGDVVPVTTRARLLVGTEAVAGVVIAGLFLNAIGRGRRQLEVGKPEQS